VDLKENGMKEWEIGCTGSARGLGIGLRVGC
jgi:hypothetical protein